MNNVCEKSPCPEGMECVEDLRENEYSCVCPEGKKGKCSGKTSRPRPTPHIDPSQSKRAVVAPPLQTATP